MIYRFTKKAQQSGVIREAKRRRFEVRPLSRVKIRLSAIHRARKRTEFERLRKLGIRDER
jgi:ribosomal protein S21